MAGHTSQNRALSGVSHWASKGHSKAVRVGIKASYRGFNYKRRASGEILQYKFLLVLYGEHDYYQSLSVPTLYMRKVFRLQRRPTQLQYLVFVRMSILLHTHTHRVTHTGKTIIWLVCLNCANARVSGRHVCLGGFRIWRRVATCLGDSQWHWHWVLTASPNTPN